MKTKIAAHKVTPVVILTDASGATHQIVSPDLNLFLLAHGVELLEAGKVDEAISVAPEAHVKHPDEMEVRLLLVRCLLLAENAAEALPHAKQCVQTEPDRPDVWLALAVALFHAGEPTQALDAAKRCIALAPADAEGYQKVAGILLEANQSPTEAEVYARKATRLDPEKEEGWLTLGLAFARQAKWKEAHDAYSRAIKLAPESQVAQVAASLIANLPTKPEADWSRN